MLKYKGHTLTELLIASVIVTILFASVIGAFVVTKTIYQGSIVGTALQRDVNTIVNRLIRGIKEQTGTFGLRAAKSFTLPIVNPAGSRIDFVGTDGNTRRCFLSGNSIIYFSPTQTPNQQTIYTAPSNSNISLRFWEPTDYIDHQTVGIYLSISQQVEGRTASGSSSTYINLRNLPK